MMVKEARTGGPGVVQKKLILKIIITVGWIIIHYHLTT